MPSLTLTLTQANQIIAGALAKSNASGFKPMGIVVLDDAGHLKAFAREDGASMFRFEVAQGKAWGAVLDQHRAGNVLGAVGASGGTGDEDELICIAGIESAGFTAG
jgi:uncharacterized protein GlcG (DUF336 family)